MSFSREGGKLHIYPGPIDDLQLKQVQHKTKGNVAQLLVIAPSLFMFINASFNKLFRKG